MTPEDWLRERRCATIAGRDRLAGGTHSAVERIALADGSSVVAKRAPTAPPDLYAAEADGLEALRGSATPRVPTVLARGRDWLLLEDLGAGAPRDGFWDELAARLAQLHARVASRFGFARDTWFGPLRQANAWDEDGHRFCAERRILPRLRECEAAMSADDRRGVERLCARLPQLVPATSPRLLHGDLWRTNVVVCADGGPALVDPAAHYGWPLIDLGSARLWGGFPERFFAAYADRAALDPGWREHAAVLDVIYLLGMVAAGATWCVADVRARVARFA